MKLATLKFGLALFAGLHCIPAHAQWNPSISVNTPVCVMNGNQIDLRMESDGKNGAYVVWKDYRASVPDIYMQRVNAAGVAMWATNGIPLCTNPYDQSTPAIVTDMQGGVIVAWSDWRSGIERDLYAQRVDSNGNTLWTTNGQVVTNKIEREHNERIISDGAGGAIVVWEQQRNTDFTWDIWAQRINSNGAMVWAVGGIPLVVDNSNRINPRIQSDGKGGLFVAWQDYRNGLDYDVYAQHLDANGTRLWGTTGKPIAVTSGTQINPKIDPDSASGGIYVAWTDNRMGGIGYDIYAQRLDSTGTPFWTANGVVVCNATNTQSAPDILSNRLTDGLIVTWKDKRSGNYDIYIQKLNTAGVPQWTPNGMLISFTVNDQVNPNICTDKAGGAIVVWQNEAFVDFDVAAQRVDVNGNILWNPSGTGVCNAFGNQTSPKNISDGNGGSIFAWQDPRSGNDDIYIHHLYADGTPIVAADDAAPALNITASPNPFSDRLELRNLPQEIETIQITDLSGRRLGEIPAEAIVMGTSGSECILDAITYFPISGMYLIHISSKSGSETLKVVRTAE